MKVWLFRAACWLAMIAPILLSGASMGGRSGPAGDWITRVVGFDLFNGFDVLVWVFSTVVAAPMILSGKFVLAGAGLMAGAALFVGAVPTALTEYGTSLPSELIWHPFSPLPSLSYVGTFLLLLAAGSVASRGRGGIGEKWLGTAGRVLVVPWLILPAFTHQPLVPLFWNLAEPDATGIVGVLSSASVYLGAGCGAAILTGHLQGSIVFVSLATLAGLAHHLALAPLPLTGMRVGPWYLFLLGYTHILSAIASMAYLALADRPVGVEAATTRAPAPASADAPSAAELLRSGRPERALATLSESAKAGALSPGDTVIRACAYAMLVGKGKVARGPRVERLFDEALQVLPADEELHTLMTAAARTLGREEAMADRYRGAWKDLPYSGTRMAELASPAVSRRPRMPTKGHFSSPWIIPIGALAFALARYVAVLGHHTRYFHGVSELDVLWRSFVYGICAMASVREFGLVVEWRWRQHPAWLLLAPPLAAMALLAAGMPVAGGTMVGGYEPTAVPYLLMVHIANGAPLEVMVGSATMAGVLVMLLRRGIDDVRMRIVARASVVLCLLTSGVGLLFGIAHGFFLGM